MLQFPKRRFRWSGKAQSGFYLDFFLKKICDSFLRNVFISAALFFGEKCAIVAPTDFGFALARVHGALCEGSNRETSVFRDFNETLAWLGVELDDEELIMN